MTRQVQSDPHVQLGSHTGSQGCTNKGSGIRHIEAWVVGINEKGGQDWRLLCESTPMTWDHITYETPTHCDPRVSITPDSRSLLPP